MINKEFQKNFLNLSFDKSSINDKVFRDFIKYLKNVKNMNLNTKQIQELNEVVVATTAFNKRMFVSQSDLWAMIQSDIFFLNSNIIIFEEAIFETMFKEQLEYIHKNVEFKDNYSEKKATKILTPQEIVHANQLLEWTIAYIRKLEQAFDLAFKSDQVSNTLTQKKSQDFFIKKHEEVLRIFKWHKLGFEIITER